MVWNRIDAVIDFSPSLVAAVAAAGVGPSFLTTTSATGFGY